MHKFALIVTFAVFAAGISSIAIMEAVARDSGQSHLIIRDAYLPVVRFTAFGLWMLTGMAVATRGVRRTLAKHLDQQTERITSVVKVCVDAVLKDMNQRKRADIDGMLKEYGIDTNAAKRTGTEPDSAGLSINLLPFRSRNSGGDT